MSSSTTLSFFIFLLLFQPLYFLFLVHSHALKEKRPLMLKETEKLILTSLSLFFFFLAFGKYVLVIFLGFSLTTNLQNDFWKWCACAKIIWSSYFQDWGRWFNRFYDILNEVEEMGSHQVHLPWAYDSITGIYYSIWVPGWDGLWMKKWKNWIQKKYMGRCSWVQHIVVITQSLQLNALHIFLVPYSIHIKFQKKKNGRSLMTSCVKAGTGNQFEMWDVTFDRIIGYWFWHHGSYLTVWLDMISSAYPLNVCSFSFAFSYYLFPSDIWTANLNHFYI